MVLNEVEVSLAEDLKVQVIYEACDIERLVAKDLIDRGFSVKEVIFDSSEGETVATINK